MHIEIRMKNSRKSHMEIHTEIHMEIHMGIHVHILSEIRNRILTVGLRKPGGPKSTIWKKI